MTEDTTPQQQPDIQYSITPPGMPEQSFNLQIPIAPNTYLVHLIPEAVMNNLAGKWLETREERKKWLEAQEQAQQPTELPATNGTAPVSLAKRRKGKA